MAWREREKKRRWHFVRQWLSLKARRNWQDPVTGPDAWERPPQAQLLTLTGSIEVGGTQPSQQIWLCFLGSRSRSLLRKGSSEVSPWKCIHSDLLHYRVGPSFCCPFFGAAPCVFPFVPGPLSLLPPWVHTARPDPSCPNNSRWKPPHYVMMTPLKRRPETEGLWTSRAVYSWWWFSLSNRATP